MRKTGNQLQKKAFSPIISRWSPEKPDPDPVSGAARCRKGMNEINGQRARGALPAADRRPGRAQARQPSSPWGVRKGLRHPGFSSNAERVGSLSPPSPAKKSHMTTVFKEIRLNEPNYDFHFKFSIFYNSTNVIFLNLRFVNEDVWTSQWGSPLHCLPILALLCPSASSVPA